MVIRPDGSWFTAANVGVDVRDYAPCSFNEIMSSLKRWERANLRTGAAAIDEIEAYLARCRRPVRKAGQLVAV